jgi:hypothetical protein
MAELTIQIPDELAQRLEPLRNRLPELLSQLVDRTNFSASTMPEVQATSSHVPAVYLEVLDFLIKRPTPEEIIAFKVSPEGQKRLQTLLHKNRETTLTQTEIAELDVYEQLEHLMILLKARANNTII